MVPEVAGRSGILLVQEDARRSLRIIGAYISVSEQLWKNAVLDSPHQLTTGSPSSLRP